MIHDNDNRGDCAHCAIVRALDEFNAAHSPMSVEVLIDDITAVLCEHLAMYDDRNERRREVKEICELIPKRVAAFRADGRYPGSPEQRRLRAEMTRNGGDA